MIGSFFGSALTFLLFPPNRRSRNMYRPPRRSYGAPRRRGSNPPPPGKKPRFPPARVLSPDGSTIGYRSINYPDQSPDRRPTNPFNGERIPSPPPREP